MTDLNTQTVGLNQATLSTFGCMIFTLIGAYGQYAQVSKIWKSRRADNVSGFMTIVMCTLFCGYLVRGVSEARLMHLFQGTVRVGLYLPIIFGIVRFGTITLTERTVAWIAGAILAAMAALPNFRMTGFYLVMYAGVFASAHQAWKIRSSNGKVSFTLYLTFFLSVLFQVWYGFTFKDWAVFSACSCFMIVYGTILVLWIKNHFGQTGTS
jgi:uncharacterized protein with PQ loop repeat